MAPLPARGRAAARRCRLARALSPLLGGELRPPRRLPAGTAGQEEARPAEPKIEVVRRAARAAGTRLCSDTTDYTTMPARPRRVGNFSRSGAANSRRR